MGDCRVKEEELAAEIQARNEELKRELETAEEEHRQRMEAIRTQHTIHMNHANKRKEENAERATQCEARYAKQFADLEPAIQNAQGDVKTTAPAAASDPPVEKTPLQCTFLCVLLGINASPQSRVL